MSLRNLVISFFIFFLAFPSLAFSLDCKYLKDEKGKIDRVVKCDGQIYYIFPKKKAEKMLSDLKKYKLKSKKVSLLKKKNKLLKTKNDVKDRQIELYKNDRDYFKSLYQKTVKDSDKIYKKDWFQFGVSFLTIGLMYGFWSCTSGGCFQK